MEDRTVLTPNGCIEYTGFRLPRGYGMIGVDQGGRSELTHRVAWALANGPIPDGVQVCHSCDNPPCCNVEHLFLGTAHENMQDMARKGRSWQSRKTHCPHGHEYTLDNTMTMSNGGRACVACHRERNRRTRMIVAMVASIRQDRPHR